MCVANRLALSALFSLLLGLLASTVNAVRAEGGPPLSEADLIKRIQLPLDEDVIVTEVQKKGVSFALDAEAKERLQKAGASPTVLAAVQKAAEARRPAAAVSYADVLALLQKGTAEGDILKRLADSPTVYTLDDRQVEELKKAGASDRLLAAMRENRSVAGKHTDVTAFAVILDCSGSMREKTKDGPSKMDAAKEVVTKLIQDIPNGMDVTFLVYGTDVKRECEDVTVVRPLGPLDDAGKAELTKYIAGLEPVGHTPIALALRKAGEELGKSKGISELVLITDGMETCNGDPAKEAAVLARTLKLRQGVSIIGMDVQPEERAAIAKIAEEGKGKYYSAETGKELARIIQTEVVAKVVEPVVDAPPAELSPEAKALVERLKSKDVAVRRAAAVDLGKLKEKATVPALIAALNDRDPVVRTTAAADLQDLADKSAVPALVKRVADDVGDDDDDSGQGWWGVSKNAALNALKSLDPDKMTGALADALKSKSERVRLWACANLGVLTDNKAAVDALIGAMSDRMPSVRTAAASGLGKLGDAAAAPALIKALNDKDVSVRAAAAAGLEKAAEKGNKNAVEALVKRVADDVGDDDENSGRGWWGVSKVAALGALKALDSDRMTEALAAALKSKNERVRLWAAGALSDQDDKDSIAALIQALGDKLPTIRATAATSLGKLGEVAAEPALINALSDKDVSVRAAAAAGLQQAAQKGDKSAVEALVKRVADDLGDDDENSGRGWWGVSKVAALGALKALDSDRMTEALGAALKSRNERVRLWAAGSLGDQNTNAKEAKEAVVVLVPALNDKAATVRTVAAAALLKLDEKDAVPALVKRVADDVLEGDPADKNAALAALKALDPDKVKAALTTASQSTNAAVKDWAVAQLATPKDQE